MKKTVICLLLVAVGLAAASCFFDREEITEMILPANIVGTSWGTQPYGGTSWGDESWETVTFREDSTVVLSYGALDGLGPRSYGTFETFDLDRKIKIDGLTIFDKMSGKRYKIVEGYVTTSPKTGARSLRLAYSDGTPEPVYNALFNYQEITELIAVNPWEPDTTVLLP